MSILTSIMNAIEDYLSKPSYHQDLKRFAEIEYKHDSDFAYYVLLSKGTTDINLDEVIK